MITKEAVMASFLFIKIIQMTYFMSYVPLAHVESGQQ